MKPRLQKLRNKLIENGLDAIFISQPDNRRYLSGFVGTAGYLLITPQDAILSTDFRYTQQAATQAPDFQVFQIKGELGAWFPSLLSQVNIKTLGFESADLSFYFYQKLKEALNITGQDIQLTPVSGLVEGLRSIKEPEEIYNLNLAAKLADDAFNHCVSVVHRGMTEKELAWEIEKYMREKGSSAVPFELIVAAGESSAMPHHQPTNRPIGLAEPVIIDIGSSVDGYMSDLSRTICLERQDKTYDKIYNIVLEAQMAAIQQVESGRVASEVDSYARDIIARAGYSEAFGHGLGHGIGLASHEEPRLGPFSSTILEENMVFTIEPGIYIKDWGGVRIEDMVVIEKGKARVLTQSTK